MGSSCSTSGPGARTNSCGDRPSSGAWPTSPCPRKQIRACCRVPTPCSLAATPVWDVAAARAAGRAAARHSLRTRSTVANCSGSTRRNGRRVTMNRNSIYARRAAPLAWLVPDALPHAPSASNSGKRFHVRGGGAPGGAVDRGVLLLESPAARVLLRSKHLCRFVGCACASGDIRTGTWQKRLGGDRQGGCELSQRGTRSQTLASLSLRLTDLLGPVTRVKQEKKRNALTPLGRLQTFHQKSTSQTQFTLTPFLVQIWSRHPPASGANETFVPGYLAHKKPPPPPLAPP